MRFRRAEPLLGHGPLPSADQIGDRCSAEATLGVAVGRTAPVQG